MTFLNLALLAGAGALLVPLLVHLISRRRLKPVAWGATFLLEHARRSDTRRVRIERWLLLAMRCAVPVLLALAMARPVLTGWRVLLGDAPASAVIVLDASYSMAAAGPDAGPAAARDAARRVLDELPAGSEASVLLVGGGIEPLGESGAFLSPQTLAAAIETVAFDRGPADLSAALAAANDLLRDAPHRRRDVILVSDFRGEALPELNERDDDDEPAVTLLRVGGEAATPAANVAVESVELSPALPAAGRPFRARVALRNTGPVALTGLRLRLDLDGVTRDAATLDLAPGAAAQAVFTARLDTPGPHTLRAWVDAAGTADALPGDDDFFLALDVPAALPVLLVAGETSRPFPENPADFLQLALAPDDASPLQPRVVRAADLDAAAAADARAIVLANVPQLAPAQTRLLRDFVEAGGGLVVFPGDRSQPSYYDAEPLFPATLAALRGDGEPTRVSGPPYSHPALLPWNDPANGRLGEATIRRWYRLEPKSYNDDAAPTVAAAFDNGDPLFVERPVGRGVVLMLATSAAADWSDLPLRGAFLPLAQQLAYHAAARSSPPRTLSTGDAIVFAAAPDAPAAVVVTPAGDRRATAFGRFDATLRPGLYGVESDTDAGYVAVNAPRSESDLPPVPQTEPGRLVDGADAYARLDDERRFGRELWPAAWAAVLVLLFAELFVQRDRGGRP